MTWKEPLDHFNDLLRDVPDPEIRQHFRNHRQALLDQLEIDLMALTHLLLNQGVSPATLLSLSLTEHGHSAVQQAILAH